MAVTLTLSGSGTVGNIEPGWSVSEDATPVAPGNSSGGVGSVNLSARQGTHSEYIVDETSTFTHDRLGAITGKVSVADTSGATTATQANVGITATTVLTQLNVDRTATPLGEGILLAAWGGA